MARKKEDSKKEKKPMGRPQVQIDKNNFESLCAIFCTEEEIADFFDCSVDTISRWCQRTYGTTFADIYKRKSARGKISLRRLQYQSAQAGNVTMQIFLGKLYLDQRENEEKQQNDMAININVVPATEENIEID